MKISESSVITKKTGITLIALIITIIVILILAGVSMNFIFGNEGILNKTQFAVEKYKNSTIDEEAIIAKISNSINSNRDDSEEIVLLKKKKQTKGVNPTGTIIAFYGNIAPTGYLACDGSSKNVSEYKDLAEFLGVDVSTEIIFNLPNLQGEFLRGAGTNSHTTQGSGGVVREHQDGTEHPSVFLWGGTNFGIYTPNVTGAAMNNNTKKIDSNIEAEAYYRQVTNASGESQTGVAASYTSRPTNTSVLYCIKY